MAKKSKFGSMKRYGPRYGRRNKEKAAALEQEYRFKHVCPQCNYEKLKRIAAGIWQCEKCGVKFAGKAYATPKKKKVQQEKVQEDIEDVEEVEEVEEDEDYNEDEDQEETEESEGEDTEEADKEEPVDENESSEEPEDQEETVEENKDQDDQETKALEEQKNEVAE